MKEKCFSETRFVTINFARDWLNGIRDWLGHEQVSYNEAVNEISKKVFKEIESKGEIIWFRQIVDRTLGKTLQVTIYGMQRDKND